MEIISQVCKIQPLWAYQNALNSLFHWGGIHWMSRFLVPWLFSSAIRFINVFPTVLVMSGWRHYDFLAWFAYQLVKHQWQGLIWYVPHLWQICSIIRNKIDVLYVTHIQSATSLSDSMFQYNENVSPRHKNILKWKRL